MITLAPGFAVGFVLNSHWVRQHEESALQMRQAGFERELGEVFITGFKKAGTIANQVPQKPRRGGP